MAPANTAPLKLAALDAEDLAVVSAHLQDAVVNSTEVLWRPQEHRLVIGLNRFDWECAHCEDPEYRRRRAALRFERVQSVKCRDLDPTQGEDILNLLAVEFSETDAPSGVITLTFSGGPALRVEVECLEAELADLGPTWTCSKCPEHKDVPQTA
jgi:Protein of unknown function (DUF2948)